MTSSIPVDCVVVAAFSNQPHHSPHGLDKGKANGRRNGSQLAVAARLERRGKTTEPHILLIADKDGGNCRCAEQIADDNVLGAEGEPQPRRRKDDGRRHVSCGVNRGCRIGRNR